MNRRRARRTHAGRQGNSKLGHGKVVASCLRETLRVYPPIGGLPRVSACPFSVGDGGPDFEGRHYFIFDLIAAAHGRCPRGSTWNWLPGEPEARSRGAAGGAGAAADGRCSAAPAPPQAREAAPAKPFGIGPRQCPAGTLSLALVARLVHHLVLEYVSGLSLARACQSDALALPFDVCPIQCDLLPLPPPLPLSANESVSCPSLTPLG